MRDGCFARATSVECGRQTPQKFIKHRRLRIDDA